MVPPVVYLPTCPPAGRERVSACLLACAQLRADSKTHPTTTASTFTTIINTTIVTLPTAGLQRPNRPKSKTANNTNLHGRPSDHSCSHRRGINQKQKSLPTTYPAEGWPKETFSTLSCTERDTSSINLGINLEHIQSRSGPQPSRSYSQSQSREYSDPRSPEFVSGQRPKQDRKAANHLEDTPLLRVPPVSVKVWEQD